MSSLTHSLVTWADFLQLPERDDAGKRYELHDGEVVVVAPPRPFHIKLQKWIERLLEAQAGDRGVVTTEFPYRPVQNLQFWFADVAYVPRADWDAMPPDEYPVYSPPLIIEVLSPSNTTAKIDRQRIVALSAGPQEFWVVDSEKRTVHVAGLNGERTYGLGETIPLLVIGVGALSVQDIFKQ